MKIPKKVRRVSEKETRSLSSRSMKLVEEVGELMVEILRLQGEKSKKGKTVEEVRADLHLEAVDTMLMAMDILVHTGASDATVKKIMNSQLKKWEVGINKRN